MGSKANLEMKFSVLLSLYYKESPENLRLSLNSVFFQTLLADEVVLVKDGSLTADLERVLGEFLAKYPVLRVVPLSQNQGLGRALNEGLKHCSNEVVARMDTDDVAKPTRFEKQIRVMMEHPEYDVVGTWTDEFIGDVRNVVSQRKLPEKQADIYRFARKRNPLNHPTVMFRKSAVLAAGGYQHFPLFEDYYLWIRMLMNGAVFYNVPECLLYFRMSSDVYKRRGGWKYAQDEVRLRRQMYRIGFISRWDYYRETPVRFIVRIIPASIRKLFYRVFLRG